MQQEFFLVSTELRVTPDDAYSILQWGLQGPNAAAYAR